MEPFVDPELKKLMESALEADASAGDAEQIAETTLIGSEERKQAKDLREVADFRARMVVAKVASLMNRNR